MTGFTHSKEPHWRRWVQSLIDATSASYIGGAEAGGSDTEIQYNNGTALGGLGAAMTYNDGTDVITFNPAGGGPGNIIFNQGFTVGSNEQIWFGDNTTYITGAATDTIGFITGSTERLLIDSHVRVTGAAVGLRVESDGGFFVTDASAPTSIAGTVVLSGLPTSDPTNADELWNDSGTLKISAG